MKRLTTLSFASLALMVLMTMPLDAQSRGGNSRNSGGGNNTRTSGTRTTKTTSQSSSSSSRKSGTADVQNGKKQSSGDRQTLPAKKPGTGQPARTGSNVPSGNRQVTRPSGDKRPAGNSRPSEGNRPGQQSPSAVRPGVQGHGHSGVPHQPAPNVGKSPRPVHVDNSHRGPSKLPPRHRDPIGYDRPSRFWDPGRHYFGYKVHYLPQRYVRRVYWGIPYYIIDDIYYRYDGVSYYICRPPFGVPFNPVVDNISRALCRFAYYADAYYVFSTVNKNAEQITRQNAVIAANNATIARQNAEIAMNSQRATASMRAADGLGLVQSYAAASTDYYYDDGVFFTKNSSGQYVTIVPPAGALVENLPEDYEVIVLNGEEYYAVDDTVYRTVVVDGTPYFEVLGQKTA